MDGSHSSDEDSEEEMPDVDKEEEEKELTLEEIVEIQKVVTRDKLENL